jgi:hypothetical protein
MLATAAQRARIKKDWTRIAGEPVEVEQIGSCIYGFCGELGTLRLLKEFRRNEKADAGWSANLAKPFFRIEL